MTETKYGSHIINIPFKNGAKGPVMSLNSKILPGFNAQVIYACAYEASVPGKPGILHKKHTHNYTEALFFIGSDPYKFDELGAEVELSMGEEEEKFVFSKPTAVVVPKGLPHCPIVTRKLDKPYVLFVVRLTDDLNFRE